MDALVHHLSKRDDLDVAHSLAILRASNPELVIDAGL